MRKAQIALATAALVSGSALTGSADARDRDRVDITTNQIVDHYNARTARIKADLRLTPEQEKNWGGSKAP